MGFKCEIKSPKCWISPQLMSSLSPLSSRTPPVSTISTRLAAISSTPPAVKGIFKIAFKIEISNPNLTLVAVVTFSSPRNHCWVLQRLRMRLMGPYCSQRLKNKKKTTSDRKIKCLHTAHEVPPDEDERKLTPPYAELIFMLLEVDLLARSTWIRLLVWRLKWSFGLKTWCWHCSSEIGPLYLSNALMTPMSRMETGYVFLLESLPQ